MKKRMKFVNTLALPMNRDTSSPQPSPPFGMEERESAAQRSQVQGHKTRVFAGLGFSPLLGAGEGSGSVPGFTFPMREAQIVETAHDPLK